MSAENNLFSVLDIDHASVESSEESSWYDVPDDPEERLLDALAAARESLLGVLASEGEAQQCYLCDAERAFGMAR